jgi:hypothetical protein
MLRSRSKGRLTRTLSIQGLQPLEKAEAWLSYVADDIEYWGDQEALVYLKSRGRDCSAQINKLVSVWKTAVLCGKLMMQLPSRRLEEPFEATGQIRY